VTITDTVQTAAAQGWGSTSKEPEPLGARVTVAPVIWPTLSEAA
jgi:hypothetical protein